MFCFTNISTEILLYGLSNSYCADGCIWHIFANAVASKSVKNYLRKSCCTLALKTVDEINFWIYTFGQKKVLPGLAHKPHSKDVVCHTEILQKSISPPSLCKVHRRIMR